MAAKTQTAVEYEVALSRNAVANDEYVVEGIDYENDGQIYAALFNGPQAKERAEEYARFKNAQH